MMRMKHTASADPVVRCARVVRIVATHKGIPRSLLLNPTRSRSAVASARQLAMYLCHVLLELNLTEVGRYFGRDRTTVAHACALVEDAREDLGVDAEIQTLEDRITHWIGQGASPLGEKVHDAVH